MKTGICPICGGINLPLTGDGRLAPHNVTFLFNGQDKRKRCPGTMRNP